MLNSYFRIIPVVVMTFTSIACIPNQRDRIDINSSQDATTRSPEKKPEQPLTDIQSNYERLSFQLRIPVYLPEGAAVDAEARVLSLTCSPAVGILKQSSRILDASLANLEFNLEIEAYSSNINCKSLIVADSAEHYFEASLKEMIRIPKANKSENSIAVRNPDEIRQVNEIVVFQPISLPSSSLIERKVAREIALQENERQRLEREAAKALAHQQELERQLREIEASKEKMSQAEQALAEEKRRNIILEETLNNQLVAQIRLEQELADARAEQQRLARELEREAILRRETAERLKEKERQLEEERSRSRNEQAQGRQILRTVEIADPQFVQCPSGTLLNLNVMSCE